MNEDIAVRPFSYNPSSWSQRIPICLLALVAVGISTHLAMFQWNLIDTVWDPVFGKQSDQVLKSDTAKWMYGILGIHDAALGALAYLGDAIFGFAGSTNRWKTRPWLVILFGIDVIPLGIVSVLLVLVQTFVLGTWCFLCLVTAVISLVLVYWAWDEVYVSLKFLWTVWTQQRSCKLLWLAVWGIHTSELDAAAEKMIERA